MTEQVALALPTFHPGQKKAFDIFRKHKLVAGRCGRRWGKTDFAKIIACDAVAKGRFVGWFAPSYKILSEAYNEIAYALQDVKRTSSKMQGVITTIKGGRIDFWTLENERAGRSRKYHQVIIDEAAFAKPNMMDVWEQAIKPTLVDFAGHPFGDRCLAISNANGVAEDNFFYQICEPEFVREPGVPGKVHKFVEFHAPTHENPYMPAEKLDALERDNHPLVYQQEYLADFVNFNGIAFFAREKLLFNGEPVDYPRVCEFVVAVIDTAVKEGQEHDGTAVSYWAKMHSYETNYKLVCLDWDIVSIDGAMLEAWIPDVYARLQELSETCKAAYGSIGAYIEDAQSGSILLQQCELRGYAATPLPAQLTAAGKDARAINASGPVFRGEVKFSRYAYEKTTKYRKTERNHMLSQISGFRVGDKEAAKRADDLLDTFTYSVAINLGGAEGIA